MKYFMIAMLLASFPSVSHAASFDCAKASTEVEKLVCSNEELSKLDDRMAVVYKDKLAAVINKAGFRGMQNDWRIIMNKKCHDVACVKKDYETQIADLEAYNEESYSANYKTATLNSLSVTNFRKDGFDARFVQSNVDDNEVYCAYPKDDKEKISFSYVKPDQAVWEKNGCRIVLDTYGGAKEKVATIKVTSEHCENLCDQHNVFDDHYIPDYEPVPGNQ